MQLQEQPDPVPAPAPDGSQAEPEGAAGGGYALALEVEGRRLIRQQRWARASATLRRALASGPAPSPSLTAAAERAEAGGAPPAPAASASTIAAERLRRASRQPDGDAGAGFTVQARASLRPPGKGLGSGAECSGDRSVPACLPACHTLRADSLLQVVSRQVRPMCNDQPPASGRPGERAAGPGRGARAGRPLRGRAAAGGGGAVPHSGRAARRPGMQRLAAAACCCQSRIPRDSPQPLALSHQRCAPPDLRDPSRAGAGSRAPAPRQTARQALQVVRGAVLLLTAASDANPATLGAARAALGAALAPAETTSDAHALAHALLSQAEALRRKPERAVAHIQQVSAACPLSRTAAARRRTSSPVAHCCARAGHAPAGAGRAAQPVRAGGRAGRAAHGGAGGACVPLAAAALDCAAVCMTLGGWGSRNRASDLM
jgi:hypothetical protein